MKQMENEEPPKPTRAKTITINVQKLFNDLSATSKGFLDGSPQRSIPSARRNSSDTIEKSPTPPKYTIPPVMELEEELSQPDSPSLSHRRDKELTADKELTKPPMNNNGLLKWNS